MQESQVGRHSRRKQEAGGTLVQNIRRQGGDILIEQGNQWTVPVSLIVIEGHYDELLGPQLIVSLGVEGQHAGKFGVLAGLQGPGQGQLPQSVPHGSEAEVGEGCQISLVVGVLGVLKDLQPYFTLPYF